MPLSPEKQAQLRRLTADMLAIPYSPEAPTVKQARFLLDFDREALYGGAAGGGKSSALLMAALQFIEVPGYSAIIFRRTFQDLNLPGALMDRARSWLMGKAKWDDDNKTWRFPNGSTLSFGYLEHENDKFRYQGSEFQFIGMDEVTQLSETQYRYLFSRLRRLQVGPLAKVPLRMRAATNPGGPGHGWVHRRFIEPWEQWKKGKGPKPADRNFHPATLDDNPHLDREEYTESLMQLDAVTRAQLLRGDWSVRPEGRMFKRHWFEVVRAEPTLGMRLRFWDLAATEEKPGTDPDWTAGLLLHRGRDGIYTIIDITRMRGTDRQVERVVRSQAEIDGVEVPIYMDQDPGQAGKTQVANYRRVLDGFAFYAEPASGSKIIRASPVSSQAEAGNLQILAGPHAAPFLEEIEIFPDGEHDDQVDALSGAHMRLARQVMRAPLAIPAGLAQVNPWKI